MQYDFSLAANESKTLEVAGEYFTYKSGLGAIRVTPSSGSPVDLLPGQGMGGVKFDRLTVKDLSGAVNSGFVLAGTGEWRDSRTTGTVDVVDGGYNRTQAGQAFNGSTFQSGVAGSFSHGFLSNPAGSGKRVILSSYDMASNAGCSCLVGIYPGVIGGPGPGGASKMSGGAQSTAQIVPLAQAAMAFPPVNAKVVFMTANTQYLGTLKEPIVLLPGYSFLIVLNSGTGLPLTFNVEYTEVPL